MSFIIAISLLIYGKTGDKSTLAAEEREQRRWLSSSARII
jgi:hypothetical protein